MAELPASASAVKGTPMASNKTPAAVITDTFKVVRVIQPLEGPYGPGIKVELLGKNHRPRLIHGGTRTRKP